MGILAQAVKSVPELMAAAHGLRCDGGEVCFYCGAACDGSNLASTYVRDSFTGRPLARAPGSASVCTGCVLCLREDAEFDQIDGTRRRVVKGCMRAFSWVISLDPPSALGASKAHLDKLRAAALDPPPPPFALVYSDSGQTHQLYRGVVNHARGPGMPVVVTLEAEPITYHVEALTDRLDLVGRLVAATGKPALAGPPSVRMAIAVVERYGDDGAALIEEWESLFSDPLSRLAAWLSPNKEVCTVAYPADKPAAAGDPGPGHGGVPPQAGRTGRPRSDAGDDRKGGNPRCGQPLLFDSRPPLW